jgi:tetratricopeptide (TPR) repeat protein
MTRNLQKINYLEMPKSDSHLSEHIKTGNRILYSLILVLLPFLFFLLLEVLLRAFNYGQSYSLFIDHPDSSFSEFRIINPEIGSKYFRKLEYSHPKNDIFKKKKESGCFRIFIMGSSTAAGFPYEPNLMFPRILRYRLESSFPARKFEIINTALTAINSYTLLDFTNDILAEKPDAILIYAGQNEYYGAFGIGSNETLGSRRGLVLLNMKLMNLRLYQLLRNLISGIGHQSPLNENAGGTLMGRIVKKAEIPLESREYRLGLEQFRLNISEILRKADDNNVPVFISTLFSNLRDVEPFAAISGVDRDSAGFYFKKGQEAYRDSNYIRARQLFTEARDRDCIRFRASTDINTAITELSGKYHSHLVPGLEVFEQNSPGGIPGNELLTEHVHPNIKGNFLLADAFYESLLGSGLLGAADTSSALISPECFRSYYGYSRLDSLLAHHRIENLKYHWPFRDESKTGPDYRKIYKPADFLDSLAFSIITGSSANLVDAHLKLAKHYESVNDLVNAENEYKSVVYIAPASPEALRTAAGFMIKAGDLSLALKYFQQSLEFEQSYFAFFRIGEIEMIRGDYTSAAINFNSALKITDRDYKLRILIKLYAAYKYGGNNKEAANVLNTIKKYKSGINSEIPPPVHNLLSYIPVRYQSTVAKIRKLEHDNKLSDAVSLCEQIGCSGESPVISRIAGELYFLSGDCMNAYSSLMKCYSWFRYDPETLSLLVKTCSALNWKQETDRYLEQFLKSVTPDPASGTLKNRSQVQKRN